jgi:cobalamin biosynthesis protein CobD/CbiB
MQLAVAAEYLELAEAARAALKAEAGSRKRRLAKLRRDLRRIRRRDYFPPAERDQARAAIEAVASSLEEVPA